MVARYILREMVGLLGMAVALFWSAGRLDWWPAWAALGVMGGWMIATAYIVIVLTPALLAERMEPRPEAPSWDVTILSLVGLLQLLRYILAGLDQRYGWTGGMPDSIQVPALIFCVLGYVVFTWATASNAFYSRVVRIQQERGHKVVSNGPYRWLRHPGYLGAILYELAVPLLLGSWWALLLSCLSAALLVLRTALEDRMLLAKLDGYPEYASHVRYRLLPGLW